MGLFSGWFGGGSGAGRVERVPEPPKKKLEPEIPSFERVNKLKLTPASETPAATDKFYALAESLHAKTLDYLFGLHDTFSADKKVRGSERVDSFLEETELVDVHTRVRSGRLEVAIELADHKDKFASVEILDEEGKKVSNTIASFHDAHILRFELGQTLEHLDGLSYKNNKFRFIVSVQVSGHEPELFAVSVKDELLYAH